MDGFDDRPDVRLVLAGIFIVVVVGGAIDLVLDAPASLWSAHVIFEVVMVLTSLAAASYLARAWYTTSQRLTATAEISELRNRERDLWQARAEELLKGLGRAMSDHFEGWALTPAERRTALGLLRGQSHKRIARESGTSERTVRQHSVAVYKKSGLSGRAELAGFFLEGLSLPDEDPTGETSRQAPPQGPSVP